MAELLIELFSEEIPARMQARAAEDLAAMVCGGLEKAGLSFANPRSFVTPRRLVLVLDDVPTQTPDIKDERKGPRVDAPERAIEGFLKSAGVTLDDCEIAEDKKGKFYIAKIEKPGRSAHDVIGELIPDVIRKFPWPKSMRWGDGSLRWVRPLHSIVCVLDGQIVPFEIEGIVSGNTTTGHRFMGPQEIVVGDFAGYQQHLRDQFVMLDAGERRDFIKQEADKLATSKNLKLIDDAGLIAEVAGLVEWPVVLMGDFDKLFLDVPPEVVVTTIKAHQKCFCLNDKSGKLANRYLLVSNTIARDGGKLIVAGNNRVIAARLSDAKFFWDNDRKIKLEDRLPDLEKITFHAKLGTQRARVERIESLAVSIAKTIGADVAQTQLAAKLCKTDLVTDMVGELPELQGLMGGYYAREEGLADDVVDAIANHYKPQGPTDSVPTGNVTLSVCLADKLDTLCGFWAIDEKPTGSKDPYALRRSALGVIRVILEGKLRLPLKPVLARSIAGFIDTLYAQDDDEDQATDKRLDSDVIANDLMAFFADRLKVFLRDKGIRHDLIDAVFALGDQDDLLMIVKRVEALSDFLKTDDGQNLLAGVKRAMNILKIEEKKHGSPFSGNPLPNLLVMGEEKELHRAVTAAIANTITASKNEDFAGAMKAIAGLRQPVDEFFDKVTVNADDPNFRENRLKLLNRIKEATNNVADFTKIEG